MKRLANRLYYLTETFLTRGPLNQLMLVAVVIFLLSLGGGLVVHFTNPRAYGHTGEAIWWAFLRLTDPGYLGDDRGFFPRLISTFLTVAGYVVFLGALVALMTNWLDRIFAFLASGRSPIFEEGHVLIIGWNERLHALVEEVVHTAQFQQSKEVKPAIVILCDPYHPGMQRELTQKLDPEVRNSCRLLIRSGNPLELESLQRVDFAHARSIILVATAQAADRSARSLSDITLAKVLMSMKSFAPEPKQMPNVVVEVAFSGNKLLAESMGWQDSTEAVVADDIMGRLFCQAIRFPGISKVYHRLLTDTFGDSMVLKSASDLQVVGQTLRQTVEKLTLGTPIGLLTSPGNQSSLRLLDLDRTIEANDKIVLVTSREERKCALSLSAPDFTVESFIHLQKERRLLVIGWSTDLTTLLVELSATSEEHCHVTLLWESPRPREKERLERLQQAASTLTLTFLEGTLLDEVELKRAQIENFDTVVLLADQTQKPLVADAENVLRFVLISRLVRARSLQLRLVVELNDEDNRALLKGVDCDVLMTAEILSHLLAQVATHRSLMWIYEELFTNGGAELRLRHLSFLPPEGATFGACQAAALAAGSIALGFLREGRVVFNPSDKESLAQQDSLIIVEMEDSQADSALL